MTKNKAHEVALGRIYVVLCESACVYVCECDFFELDFNAYHGGHR
jgi:hypothetical protein